ncbi:acyl-CoA dehydrogenase family protein [Aquitalea sp. ASV11]|uniref:acyl-CoA dehydrogenase family protein n=1 Tax=Aquitalea sp. ASV11 TaxID=2795103 RepID=UPI0018ECF9FF
MAMHQDGHGGNNIPDSRNCNFFASDKDLAALLSLHLGDEYYSSIKEQLFDLGGRITAELDELALLADRNPPVLYPRNRRAESVDHIEKHPAYIKLEKVAYSELGLASLSHDGKNNPPLLKYALTYLFVQAEFGLCCPVSMTDSLTRTLCKFGEPELVARYLPHLSSRNFDQLYQGAMFITEQQAGSDVGQVATRAVRGQAADGSEQWQLYGDKWFCSNPDADLAMVLARPEGAPEGIHGLGLFLLPKQLPDGTRNAYRIVRLKPKMGTRSMASGEIVLQGATAYLIGQIGRGFQQMADMINMSRLSNGVRSAGLMRRALSEALFVAGQRQAFGKRLIDMPLMQRQLLKMLLPTEQGRSMFMHTAQMLGRADAGDASAQGAVRLLTPLIKFRTCRDARRVTGDAMEVRGGLGYIEEWSDARTVRDAHLGSIWEGTSNIVALDILRAVKRAGALPPLLAHARALLDEAQLPAASDQLFRRLLQRAADNLVQLAERGEEQSVRQAGSLFYHVLTALFMAWEGAQLAPNYRRLALAHLVLRHRVLPQDPMQLDDAALPVGLATKLLADQDINLDEAMTCLPAGAQP